MNTMDELMPRTAEPAISPQSLSDYFEVLSKAVFKSGISWGVVEARWGGLRAAFDDFDPARVASFTPDTVERMMSDARIVRSRAKIQATVANAAAIVTLDRAHGGFRNYLRSHDSFEDAVDDLTSRFRCLGDSGAYFFLQTVGERVPPRDEWFAARRDTA
jgi:3-methyladenine DNA glycosylase Tag